MDILDLIILAIVILGGWNGYRLGLFRQITRLFGAVIAYVLGLWLRPYLTPVIDQFLQNSNLLQGQTGMMQLLLGNLSGALSFTIIFIVSFVVLRYAAGLIDALFSLPILSFFNRMAGMVAGLVLAILFIYIGTLVAHYINNPRVATALEHSAIVRWIDVQGPLARQQNG